MTMNIRLSIIVAAVWLLSGATEVFAGPVSVREESRAMTTYPFSDPSPVVDPSRLYYPYTRFDGFTDKPIKKEWKTVVMENDYIRLTIFPEIGGKVWGAVDKTSGKEFIYENSVVKFRDIAMRGPWVSGGIEYNFGIIGHAPTSSAPVDYLIREKEDGSVSCYLSSFELIARTMWTVEVNLQPDKGYFTTRTVWYNGSSISQPYYQWMNAGYPVGNGAEFCYPGDLNIGHNGMASTFPTDSEGRDLSKYDNNMFGGTKSYHILGYYNDFYGIYWHGDDFGSVHCADFDDKLGMKIFLWGEDRAGGIWEELLTDSDGQYIELQSGRMFNQPSTMSARTPYRHFCSAPQQTDSWTEYWYPVKGIQGIDKAGKCGALNVSRQDGRLIISFSPAENFNTELRIYHDDSLAETVHLDAKVLEPVSFEVGYIPEGHMKIVLGDGMLTYSEKKADFDLERPYSVPERIDWDSAFGLYSQGKQSMYQKRWAEAGRYLEASLSKAPYLIPALVSLASLYQREGRYAEAAETAGKALALDTYCGEANYIYALANRAIGKNTEAKAAFSIAAL